MEENMNSKMVHDLSIVAKSTERKLSKEEIEKLQGREDRGIDPAEDVTWIDYTFERATLSEFGIPTLDILEKWISTTTLYYPQEEIYQLSHIYAIIGIADTFDLTFGGWTLNKPSEAYMVAFPDEKQAKMCFDEAVEWFKKQVHIENFIEAKIAKIPLMTERTINHE